MWIKFRQFWNFLWGRPKKNIPSIGHTRDKRQWKGKKFITHNIMWRKWLNSNAMLNLILIKDIFLMKKITLINITYKGTLLYEHNKSYFENSLEGFIVDSAISSRMCFIDIMGTDIECSISKTGSLRYKNI